jgi:tetratricopeptide (TPR) repeat protein
MAEANRALFAGRFDEAERLIERVELGRAGNSVLGGEDETTDQYVALLQGWALRRECGRLEEVREPIERYVAEYPSFFIFRCVLANLYSQLGRVADAQRELDRLGADGFVGLEVGTEWHFGANLLAEACTRLGDARHAAPLYDVLLPYGDCNVWAHAEFNLGSASRYLGLLASTTSRWEPAVLHFEHALEMNANMGTRPWVAHTQEDYARTLLARDQAGDHKKAQELIENALTTYRELGMTSWADGASQLEQALKQAPVASR